MRAIGLHIRIPGSLHAALEKAQRLQLPFFQCFLINQETGALLEPTQEDRNAFMNRGAIKKIYMHASYWINMASVPYRRHAALYREVAIAKKLGIQDIILHPGSAKGAQDKIEGIDALARVINEFHRKEPSCTVILENTAHGNMAIGSDLEDFRILLPKIDRPEKLSFCIDTAHAFSYGYDMSTIQHHEHFIDCIDATITLEKLVLIHLNDTTEQLGSKKDRHAMLGQGNIGIASLKSLVCSPRLAHIPLLLELPFMSEEQEIDQLNEVKQWFEKESA